MTAQYEWATPPNGVRSETVKIWISTSILGALLAASAEPAQKYRDADGKVRVAPVKMPFSGERNVPEYSPSPDYLEKGGLAKLLDELGTRMKPIPTIALSEEEKDDYGTWHRLGLANRHLGDAVAENERDGYLTIGLEANCNSVIGVLGGLQRSGPSRRTLKVGLVFIDAHGDFNTPETTLSGMLGGMPVAISAGLCLRNLRETSGLDPALPTRYMVLGAVRDTDPLEQDLLDRSEVEMISVDDIRKRSEKIHAQMERLSSLVDLIYVHIDMDVLDPREVSGHPLTVPNGPTSEELASALTEMFRYEKTAALGIASTPSGERDTDGLSLKAAYNLIEGAVLGVKQR
jgi:arginase